MAASLPENAMLHQSDPADERSLAHYVRVRGAREHNLKNVNVDIPRDALVVFTGISGSGKSSLAFGTLYAEAQRRYFESVAPYARRLIDQAGVPDVDTIEGLPPAVALQQQRGASNTRSSLGSVTTLSNSLRMLYSRAGIYPERQPMLFAEDFSPNTPQGACPSCHGLGWIYDVTEKLMVPNDSLTIRERAIAAWPPAWHGQNLRDILVTLGFDIDLPWRKLPKKDRQWILFTDDQPTVPVYAGFTSTETRDALRRKVEPSYQGTFTGVRKYVLQTFATTQSALMKKRVSRYMTGSICKTCDGKRLKREALTVTVAGLDIGAISQLPLNRVAELLSPIAAGRFDNVESPAKPARRPKRPTPAGHTAAPDIRRTPNLSEEKRIAAQRISQNVIARIKGLQALGLGYLTLERSTPTLSPGELQRLRLATQIRSNLFGVVYVLDEPSAGLHPADSEALFKALTQLKQSGNTIFVVEHDLEMMRQADWLVDVGPAAGESGGQVLYSGPPSGLQRIAESQTAHYLFEPKICADTRTRAPTEWLELRNVTRNNLQRVTARFPLRVLTTVTGVSGSGKSSLVSQALVELVAAYLGNELPVEEEADTYEPIERQPIHGRIHSGMESIQRLVRVDQKPIGRTPRSNLATYTGLFNQVRKLFAATKAARSKRYDAGRFSFNVAKGRCATCEGEGFVSVELLFLPSVYAPCPTCRGARYNDATLKILWQGKNIADVLHLTVDDACEFFAHEASILKPLTLLRDIGLGYLRLGQPATELSGGEAQRIKLATELQRTQRGNTLYVLDEPTTGLHPADVDKLMAQLQGLVQAGNSVVMVEHELRVIAASDWVIDVGPGAGDEGGRIIASGPPADIIAAPESRTGQFLRKYMQSE
ncbi:MAG: excinuclease ABC subunit UvrA [Spongiibacteraceae bacterium]